MPEGHRRRRREACWTATSTAASSPQKDADYQDPAPFIRGSSPPLTLGFHLLLKCIHAPEKLLDLRISLLNFLLQFLGCRLLRSG